MSFDFPTLLVAVTFFTGLAWAVDAFAWAPRRRRRAEALVAAGEQADGIKQINTAVEQMNQVTQTTAANAEESSSASEELTAQAEELKSLVGAYHVAVAGGPTAEAVAPVEGGYSFQGAVLDTTLDADIHITTR